MITNATEFKNEYSKKCEEMYGRSVHEVLLSEQYTVLAELVREHASVNWKRTKDQNRLQENKQMFYFSLEFLLGRLLTNNLMNLGVYEVAKEGLNELGIDIHELELIEADAGLGNGGLGRLAACFLDSLASLNYSGNGNTIRYQYGLFKQKIVNGYQEEVPDQWLKYGNAWEIRKPVQAVEIKFWGRIEMYKDAKGELKFNHVNAEHILAVPYDVPVVGANTACTNTLRLWSAEASENIRQTTDFRNYLAEVQEICLNVYPDDSNEHGKYLRLKQQYFFVAAGLSSIVTHHLKRYKTLDNLGEKVAIQLNDTHPVLAIPELMRLLMDDYDYAWAKAWEITSSVMSYTNHTVLQEALEKWPLAMIRKLLPRVSMIIEEINRQFKDYVYQNFDQDRDLWARVAIINEDQVRMANLAIVGSYRVNGVARLHTEILVNDVFKDFAKIFPNRLTNKTNGITQRRWLLYSNPELTTLIKDTIGDEFMTRFDALENLMNHITDTNVQTKFMDVKQIRKNKLASFLKEKHQIEIDPNSIFDVQAKRLHAYKRQLLNILHVIYLCQKIKADPSFVMEKQTFIFAAKAAPAYHFAKMVIKLITSVGEKIDQDPALSAYLKVVFIPNYSVSVAELLMNAANISEQISTAGKEASGTGNMKFMMNGALTIGTLDGANVEIDELVGREHDIIFGLSADEVSALKPTYSCLEYYNNNPILRRVIDSLVDASWSSNQDEFRMIYDELLYNNDEYFLFADFESYCKAQEDVQRRYKDKANFAKSCLVNIAKSPFFSSDRTIEQYVEDIWKIDRMDNM